MEDALRAYLADDEPLAIERLKRLLSPFDFVHVEGESTDPAEAVDYLNTHEVDLLFLDIQMPGMNGFELLARLSEQPLVIFTTAFDEYALRAFEVNSIDYLVKPIETEQLERALQKVKRLRQAPASGWQQNPDISALLRQLAASLKGGEPGYPRRIASRAGERVSFLDLSDVTHFLAQDKLTYAVANGRRHMVDQTIAELEIRMDPERFLRIHRSALINVDWIHEVNSWFAGKVILTLKDAQHTQLTVARDRVRVLKSRLGI